MPTPIPLSASSAPHRQEPALEQDNGQRPPSTDTAQDLSHELAQLSAVTEQVRQQSAELATMRQALENERRRYREVFELAPDAHLLTTVEGVIREANRAAAALLGVRQEFLIRKDLLLFIDESERAALLETMVQWRSASRIEGDRPSLVVRGQTRLRVYKGASFPADFTISPARDGHGQITGLRWTLRDLSEDARTAHALQEREYYYRTLFDNAGDAILIHNLTGRFLEVNRVACERLGYSREELLRMTPADLNAPEMVNQIPRRIEQLRQTDYIFFETIYLRRDGTRLPVELNSHMIEYAGGPAVLSIARDITERKRGEEALQRRADQLALLNSVGRQIAAILGLAQVFDQAARLVQEKFGYHHVALFRIDRERGDLIMEAIAGDFQNLFPPGHRIALGKGMVGWVAVHGQRLLATDVNDESRYINFYPDLIPTCSELSVPMRLGEQTLGVLDVQSPRFNAFDENDVMVMETLADQIAVAIANAQLYEAAQQAHAQA